MSITIKPGRPDAEMFKRLYDTTGWGQNDRPVSFYAEALAGSWYCIGAYDAGRLLGFGRIISDGKLHAFVTELIVHPLVQRQGVGKAILQALLARCEEESIDCIQLFAAPGKADFYERQGFVQRLSPAPGMQYRAGQKQ
jgi:GNAT superfamily N-acetyltransferase